MSINKVGKGAEWEITNLEQEELLDLLWAYDEYVRQIITENEGEPVGVKEFYENDYQAKPLLFCDSCGYPQDENETYNNGWHCIKCGHKIGD